MENPWCVCWGSWQIILFNVIDPLFRETALFWIQVWPCQKDSRINSRYFKFGGNIRCFASKALEFLRALILRSVTQHKNKTEKLLVLQLLITCEKEEK